MGRTTTRETVVGALRDRDAAQRAVDELRASGFREEQIGFAMRGTEDVEPRDRLVAGTHVAGRAMGGAAACGLLGALTSGGIPEDEAHYYEGELRAGRIILAVRPDGRAEEATDILRRHGAYYARVPEGEPPDRAAEEVADDVPIARRSS